VSRRIEAPAQVVFDILANPARHTEIDGSGMLRGAASAAPISGVGDVFVMRMYFSQLGDYEMNNHVVEYERDRRIGWEPEPGRGHPNAGGSGDSSSGGRASGDRASGDRASGDRAGWGQRWSYELTPDGPEATIVTELYHCERVPEQERLGMENGNIWRDAMADTLERLDRVCTGLSGELKQ
jgi:hypothetical protein